MGAGELHDVETFAVGTYPGDRAGEVWAYTARDLAEILANLRRLSTGPQPLHKIPVVVTHAGSAALGWVTAGRLAAGVLKTDWGQVHPQLVRAIQEGRYKKVSAEIRPDFVDRAGRHYGQYLYRVAVLGADVPRVKGLEDIPTFADREGRGRRIARALNFKGAVMDRQQMEEMAKGFGYSDDFIKMLDDKQLGALLTECQRQKSDAGSAGGAGGAAPMAAVGGQEMSREEMIAELVDTYGEDPAALEGMTDAELAALLQNYRSGAQAMGDVPDRQGSGSGAAVGAPAGAVVSGARPGAAPAGQAFADVRRLVRAALAPELRAFRRQVEQADLAQRRRAEAEQAAAKDRKVRAFCELMVKEGRLTPADLDESDPRVLCELQKLLRLDDVAVRTFSEGGQTLRTTDLEAALESIRRRAPRRFAERVPQGGAGSAGLSAERRQALLGHTPLGRSILANERKKS